jgi:hypothetical protein
MEKSNFDLSLFYQVETARLCACVLLASTPLVCRARAWKRSVGNRWERVTNRKMGTPRPHLHRDWAHPSRTCDGIGLTPPTSAPGLGAPVTHLRRDWACPCHICTGTGRAHAEMECGLTHSMGACDAVLRGMRRACRLVQG